MREHAQRRRTARRSGRRVVAIAVTTVVVLGAAGGGVALAVGRTGTETYRTATAGLGTVEQTIDATGTVASAERADASFTVAGTVASVGVAVGDTVAAGDVLASLDPTSLQDAIDEAAATLADAEQQLEDDIDSQTATTDTTTSTGTTSATTGSGTTGATGTTGTGTTGTTGSSGSSTSTPTGSATTGTSTGGTSGAGTSTPVTQAVQAVTAAQQALLARYTSATEALAASDTALTASQTACTAFLAVLPGDVLGEQVTGDSTGSGTLTVWPAIVVAGAAQKVTGAGFTAGDELDVVVSDDSGTVQVATVQVAADGTFALARLVGSAEGSATVEVRDAADATLAGVATTVVASSTSDVQSALAQCQSALTDVADAQTLVGTAQTELLQLATALDGAVADLDEAVAAGSGGTASGSTPSTGSGTGTSPGTSTGTSSGTATSGTTSSGTTSSGTTSSGTSTASTGTSTTSSGSTTSSSLGGSSSGTSTVASAADLVADQAAITLAEADLALAESQLQFVDLTTPVAGTVATVSIAAGDTVSASSTTAVITVIGATGYVVTATVPLSQVKIVEVGQSTDLEVPVTDELLTGTVSSIGVLNASTSSSTPSYTVTVAVDPTDVQLYDGSSAQVHVTVAGGEEVLTVPSSAVHLDGSTVTVQVLQHGVAQDVEVTRGAVGTELTEITEGLSEGDEVVLADLTQEMVSEESSTSTGLSGLSGSTEEESTSGRQMPDFSGGEMPSGGFGGMGAPPGS